MNIKNTTTIVVTLVALFAIGFSTNAFSGGIGSITMVGSGERMNLEVSPNARIINPPSKGNSNALFDVFLTVTEKIVKSNEDLFLSVELINFGTGDETNVSISYIITNPQGKIVLIEHEDRTVYTQDQFLKQIDLPRLVPGRHNVFVEMLYSNTSATASAEFSASLH